MVHLASMPIAEWFNHKDYIEGVRLYLEHGQDPALKKLFTSEAETPYKKQRLERALKEVLQGTTVIKKEERPHVFVKSWPVEAAKDDVLKAMRMEWIRKFKEMNDLRSQLMLLPNDDQRGEAAHQILNLDDDIEEIYAKRDYYVEHGKLPEVKQEEFIIDPMKAIKRMEILSRYIRREKLNLKKNPANVGAALRKAKFITEYNHYAKRFGAASVEEQAEAGTPTQK